MEDKMTLRMKDREISVRATKTEVTELTLNDNGVDTVVTDPTAIWWILKYVERTKVQMDFGITDGASGKLKEVIKEAVFPKGEGFNGLPWCVTSTIDNYQLLYQWLAMNKVPFGQLDEFLRNYKVGKYVGRDFKGHITVSDSSTSFDCNIVVWNTEIPMTLHASIPRAIVNEQFAKDVVEVARITSRDTPDGLPVFKKHTKRIDDNCPYVKWNNGSGEPWMGKWDRNSIIGFSCVHDVKRTIYAGEIQKLMACGSKFISATLQELQDTCDKHGFVFIEKEDRFAPTGTGCRLPKSKHTGRKFEVKNKKTIGELKEAVSPIIRPEIKTIASEAQEVIRKEILATGEPVMGITVRPPYNEDRSQPSISASWLKGAYALTTDEAERFASWLAKVKKVTIKLSMSDVYEAEWRKLGCPRF